MIVDAAMPVESGGGSDPLQQQIYCPVLNFLYMSRYSISFCPDQGPLPA
jgi:hypothetical protein